MAKTGFQYYTIDTDRYNDIRIKRLKKELGCNGIAVYDYILCEIYRVRGCFLEWDDSTAFDVADYFGLKENQVIEIVNYCCNVGLFDKELRAIGNVLTSESIQRRYIDMCRRAKRCDIEIPEQIRKIREETPKIQEETPKQTEVFDNTKYSTVKYSNTEKSKEKESECDAHERTQEPDGSTPTLTPFQDFQNFIVSCAPRVAQMQEPFTEAEFSALLKHCAAPPGMSKTVFIKQILAEMHNRANLLTANVSAYMTFKKFVKAAKR